MNVYAISCDKGVFHNTKNHRETLRVSSHSFLDANGLLLLDIRVLLVGHSCEQSCVCGSVKCGCEWRPVNSGILPLAGKIIARRPRQMYTFAISKGGVQPAFKNQYKCTTYPSAALILLSRLYPRATIHFFMIATSLLCCGTVALFKFLPKSPPIFHNYSSERAYSSSSDSMYLCLMSFH